LASAGTLSSPHELNRKDRFMDIIPPAFLKLECKSQGQLENLFANAERANRTDLAMIALAELRRREWDSDLPPELTKRFAVIMEEWEAFLSQKNGKNTKANRIRQAIQRNGLRNYLNNVVLRKGTMGEVAIENGEGPISDTFESIVSDFSDLFDVAAVESANAKLKLWGQS